MTPRFFGKQIDLCNTVCSIFGFEQYLINLCHKYYLVVQE